MENLFLVGVVGVVIVCLVLVVLCMMKVVFKVEEDVVELVGKSVEVVMMLLQKVYVVKLRVVVDMQVEVVVIVVVYEWMC